MVIRMHDEVRDFVNAIVVRHRLTGQLGQYYLPGTEKFSGVRIEVNMGVRPYFIILYVPKNKTSFEIAMHAGRILERMGFNVWMYARACV